MAASAAGQGKPITMHSHEKDLQMNRTTTRILAAAVLAAVAGIASAGGQHVVTVSASVTGVCTVTDPTSTLAFGALDPVAGGTVNATWTPGAAAQFSCTKGQAYTVSSDDGLWESAAGGANNRMRLVGAVGAGCTNAYECIRYTMTNVTSGTGNGHGAAQRISFAVTGQTLIADYQNANVGTYGDTVTLTVAP
jgi:spore coat protein U-like protein